jgi:DNA primase large subunit
MARYTREEAVKVLEVSKAKMDEAKTRDEALAILREAGKEVGYTPAFRCLVMGQTPEESIRWK